MSEAIKITSVITTREFHQRLVALGIVIPEQCSHIIIEAKVGGLVEIFFRCFADEEIVGVVFGAAMEMAQPEHKPDEPIGSEAL